MSAADSVLLSDQDDDQCPPTHVLKVTAVPAGGNLHGDYLNLTACAYDETTDSATTSVLASFGMHPLDLVEAVNLLLGRPALVYTDGGDSDG